MRQICSGFGFHMFGFDVIEFIEKRRVCRSILLYAKLFSYRFKIIQHGTILNETAENEDMSHSWQISLASLGISVLQLQKKIFWTRQNKIHAL
jgi:hypothetical protein